MNSNDSSSAYRRPESVLVVVYVSPTQVLMLQRTHPGGFWQSVTGSLEWGESANSCAQRELQEETGIQRQPINTGVINQFEIMPQWRQRYAPEVSTNQEYVFALQLETACVPILSPDEHVSYEWLEAEQAINRCFSSTNAEAIAQIVLGR